MTGHAHLLEQGHVPDISAQRACCLIRRAVYNRDVVLPHGPTVCCNKDAHGLTGKVKDPPCVQSWTAWRRSFAQSSTGRCLRSWSRLRHHSLCRSRRANFYQMLALHSCPATPRSQCALFLYMICTALVCYHPAGHHVKCCPNCMSRTLSSNANRSQFFALHEGRSVTKLYTPHSWTAARGAHTPPLEVVEVSGIDVAVATRRRPLHATVASMQGRKREDGKESWVAITTSEAARAILATRPVTVAGKYNPQSKAYLDSITPQLLDQLQATLRRIGVAAPPTPDFAVTQRWGAGFVDVPLGVAMLQEAEQRIVACGDFCLGSTFEQAAESGLAAAAAVNSFDHLPRL